MPRFNLRFLLVVVAVTAILTLQYKVQIRELFLGAYGDAPQLLMQPLHGTVTRKDGDVIVARSTYAAGKYMVSEFGSIRLAVDNPGSGRSSSSILIASRRKPRGTSATGSGTRRFTCKEIENGSRCTFGDLDFTIVNEKLNLLGETFLVTGVPKLVIVSNGKIKTILKLEGGLN